MSGYDDFINKISSDLYNSKGVDSARNALKNLYKEREKAVYDDVMYKIYSPDYYSPHEVSTRDNFIRYDEKERQQLYDYIAPKYKAMADVGVPYTDEKLGQSAVWIADVLDLDFKEARRVAPLIYPLFADRSMKEKSYWGRMGDQIASAFYGDMLGYMTSLSLLNGSEAAKQKADYFYEKQMQHRNWQNFGWAGNLLLENLQGLYSMASMALPTLLTAGVGGAIGASAKAISAFSKGVMIATSGATQAGQNYYMMSKMQDENGNALFDLDNPSWGERAVFLGSLIAMGAIETAEWELLTKIPAKLRKDISAQIAQKTVQDATIKTMKVFTGEGAKGFAKQTLKNIVGEGAEEFLQQMVGNLAECYEANLRNEEGANFSESDIAHIKDGIWEAFKGGVRGSIVASLLGGVYTTRWNNKVAEAQEKINKKVQNPSIQGDLIPADVINTSEYTFSKEEIEATKDRYAKDGGYILPAVNVEADGMTSVKPQTQADALILEAVKDIVGEDGAVKVSMNADKILDLSTTEAKVDFASRLGGEVAKSDNNVFLFQNEWDVYQAVDILGNEFLLKGERQSDGSYIVNVETENGTQQFTLIDNSNGGLKPIELSNNTQTASITLKPLKLTKKEEGSLNDYINEKFYIDDSIEKTEIKDGKFALTEREADGIKSILGEMYKAFKRTDNTVELNDILTSLDFTTVNQSENTTPEARGFTRFNANTQGGKFTRATINLSDTATLDTIVHELGHYILENANETMLQGFRTAYGIDVADKTVWRNEVSDFLKDARGIFTNNYTYEELFANDFVRYLRDGVAPNTKLKSLFEAMKSILRYVRDYLQNHLNKATREAFNNLFTDEKKGSRKESMQESKVARITALLEKDKERLLDTNKRLKDVLTEEDKKKYNELKGVLEANIKNYEKLLERERVVEETPEKGDKNGYERTNEFRELQARNKGLSREYIEALHRGDRQIYDGERQILSDVFTRELGSPRFSLWNKNAFNLTNPKTNGSINLYSNVDGSLFHDIFEIVQNYLYCGDAVEVHDVKTYEKTTNYITTDGLSGFAITEDGDLISVFSLSKEGGFLKAIAPFIKDKAKTLDCFNSTKQPLAIIYTKALGWKVASVLDFNKEIIESEHGAEYAKYFVATYGEAPVAFMVNTDVDVQEKHFGKDDYDGAKAYQMSFVDTGNIKYETSEQVLEDLTESEAIELIKAMREKGYIIPRRVAEIAGDVEENLKYAQLDNYRLMGEDFAEKAKKIIDSLDLISEDEERNIYDVALEKWIEDYTDDDGNVNIADDTKKLIELSLRLELLESTRDKNRAFIAEFGNTKEDLIKLSNILNMQTKTDENGRVITRVLNLDVDKRLLNINKDTPWREVRQIKKEVQDNATQYREAYEIATNKATDEVLFYNEWADEIKGERENTDVKGIEYPLDKEALQETEKTNRFALSGIATDLKKLGADKKSKEDIQARLNSLANEIKSVNKDIKEATDERKRLAKEEQKKKLEAQKEKYELALKKIKEKEAHEVIKRAMAKEKAKTRRLLQYNEKNMDADFILGLLQIKEQVYDYGQKKSAYYRDLDTRKAIAKRLGVSPDMTPPILSMLIDEVGINLNGIFTLYDMTALNAVISEYSKMGRAKLIEKQTARREELFNKKLAAFNQMQSEENKLNIDFQTKDSVKILNGAIADLPKKQQSKFIEGVNSLFNRTLHAPQLAHRLDGEYNGLFSQFVESEKNGERKRIAGVIDRTNKVMSRVKELGIKEQAFPYWLLDKKNEAGVEYSVMQHIGENEAPLALNRSQAIGVYIYSKNDTARTKLLSRAGNKITEDSLNHLIDEVLTDKDKAFGDMLMEEIAAKWDDMSDVFYKLYNGVLGIEENYFPLRGENAPLSVSQSESYIPNENNLNLGGGRNIISYVDKGMTYDRNESAIYPIDLNVWATFKNQLVAQERFINQAEWVRDAQYFVSDRGIGLAVQKKYGKSYQQELRSWVNDIANPRRVISDADTIFSRVVSNVAVSKMMFSLTTALKQIGALGAVFADDNFSIGSFFKASHKMLFNHKEVDSLISQYAPQILEQKGKSLSVEFARVLEANAKTKGGQVLKDFQKYGLSLIQGLDLAIRELVWVSTYEANLKATGDIESAVQRANALVDSTQNNSAISDLSSLQREPSPFARAMLVFSNQSFQYWNKIVDSKYLLQNKKYKELVGTWGMVLFNTALMVALSGLLFKKTYDDEDKKKKWQQIGLKALNDTASIIPLAGGFTDALDGYNNGNGSFGMEILTDLGKFTYNSIILDGDDKWQKLLKNAENILGDVGELTVSLPTTQINRAMKFKMTDEDESRKEAMIRGLVNILLGGEFYRNIKED